MALKELDIYQPDLPTVVLPERLVEPVYLSEHRMGNQRFPMFRVPHNFVTESSCTGFIDVSTIPRKDEQGNFIERVSKACRVCQNPVEVVLATLRPFYL